MCTQDCQNQGMRGSSGYPTTIHANFSELWTLNLQDIHLAKGFTQGFSKFLKFWKGSTVHTYTYGQLTLFKIVKTWKSLVTNCQHWRSVTSCYKSPPWWLKNHLLWHLCLIPSPRLGSFWQPWYGMCIMCCFNNNKFRQDCYSNIYQLYIVGALTVLRKKSTPHQLSQPSLHSTRL